GVDPGHAAQGGGSAHARGSHEDPARRAGVTLFDHRGGTFHRGDPSNPTDRYERDGNQEAAWRGQRTWRPGPPGDCSGPTFFRSTDDQTTATVTRVSAEERPGAYRRQGRSGTRGSLRQMPAVWHRAPAESGL